MLIYSYPNHTTINSLFSDTVSSKLRQAACRGYRETNIYNQRKVNEYITSSLFPFDKYCNKLNGCSSS